MGLSRQHLLPPISNLLYHGPWNLAAGRAREKYRRVACGPAGTDRDILAGEFQQAHSMGGVPPGSIADASAAAGWRYVEFFTANIRNPHTRRAYARACGRFFAWCESRGLMITVIR